MITLFDQQKITESFGNDKKEEGRREGKIEGMRETQIRNALAMLKAGKLSREEIVQYSGLSVAEVEGLRRSIPPEH